MVKDKGLNSEIFCAHRNLKRWRQKAPDIRESFSGAYDLSGTPYNQQFTQVQEKMNTEEEIANRQIYIIVYTSPLQQKPCNASVN